MKFLTDNLCTESATTITASSAKVNFPASNLKNPFRSKRWRSNGTFVIDTTNNKINFKESSGGSELTATLTSGTYSVSGLQTEIKTQMDAIGASDYTVTFSTTTGLWTVTSNGSFFSLLNGTGTNAAASVWVKALGFPASDKTGALTYTGSLIAIHTKESIVFDFQTSESIDSVVLLWPKEDGINLTSSAVIKVEANATNTWTSPAVSQTLTVDNTYMLASHFFSSGQSYRYWRITIEDKQNADLYVELGVVWIGQSLSFNEPENGFKAKLTDQTKIQKTDFGHEYADEYPLIAQLDFDYKYVSYATAQILENAFRSNGTKKPVLVAFDHSGSVFDKDHFLVYGKMEKNFTLDHVSYDMFNGGFKITELS